MIKNQHYVPRFYLKNFCSNKQQIAVLDKTNQKSFKTSIENIANENYFYDNIHIDKAAEIEQFLEKSFHPLEDRIALLLRKLINSLDEGSFISLDKESRLDLSKFLIYQYARTKESRETVNQMIKTITQKVADEFIKAQGGDPDKFEIVTDDKILHTNMLLNDDMFDELTNILYDHVWVFLVNKSNTEFITSDHPLVKKANLYHPFRNFSGFKSPGIEIAFPLSPKYCLLIAERSIIKIYEHLDGKTMPSFHENIIHYNSLQIINSYRFVYSRADNFDLAKDMIKDEPEIANPGRERIGTSSSEKGE